ncbi:hypothetical protein [Microbacterium caowuchunii]|uniref:ESX-1 secretion-associated protein EspA/EspE-like domain-containing protein n=1 Tax=Microbacterium caowuchunii TaxID=2614638 RepID=A0A5N0TKI6_9MICO|nr:hypothetical protein [Microbacterium caowuchunii]KAA9135512.1 hypothetical protein F6B40_03080 [Microbacterium caowuchunii]
MHPEAIAELILTGCDKTEQLVRATVAGAPAVIDAALDAVRVGWPVSVPLPGFAKDGIRKLLMAAVDEAAERIYEAIEMFRLLARSVGRPSLLRATAEILRTAVEQGGTSLGDAMQPSALAARDDEAWDSPAADSYDTAFSEQVRCVDRIPENGRALATTLDSMADSLESFFAELQYAYLGLVVGVAGLGIAIATAAPTLGVGAIIGIVVTVVGILISLGSVVMAFTNSSSRNAGLARTLSASPDLEWTTSAFAR